MKKAVFCFAVLLFLIFTGCKTSNLQKTAVHPLGLLSEDSDIYISFNPSANPLITKTLIDSIAPGSGKKGLEYLDSHISRIYGAIGSEKDSSRVEISCYSSVSQAAFAQIVSEKNGFKKFNVDGNYAYKNGKFSVAMPDKNVLCIARDIFPVLERIPLSHELKDSECNQWLDVESADFLFYIKNPNNYLKYFTGVPVNVSAETVWGRFVPLKNEYALELNMRLTNPKILKAAMTLLKISLAFSGGTLENIDEETIRLTGLSLDKDTVLALFDFESR